MQYLWWSVDWKNLMVANLKISRGTVSTSLKRSLVLLKATLTVVLSCAAQSFLVFHCAASQSSVRLNYLTAPVSPQTTHTLGLIFAYLMVWIFTCSIYVDYTITRSYVVSSRQRTRGVVRGNSGRRDKNKKDEGRRMCEYLNICVLMVSSCTSL